MTELEVIEGGGERAERNAAAVDLMQARGLRLNDKRGVVNCYANTVVICRRFIGHKLAYNTMSEMPELDGRPVTDADVGQFRCMVDETFSYSPKKEDTREAIFQVANESRYHPVQRYLEALPQWDRVERWKALPADHFGTPTAPLIVSTMLERWAVSAVARAMIPGCQVDHVLVLQGPQALRKSTFFRVLGGDWFGEGDVETGIEGVRALSRKWLWCWDELAGMSKRERSALDGFITRKEDQLRPLYRDYIDHPRSTAIVATANPEELHDAPEGLRRWWMVPVGRRMGDGEIVEIRDQLWAEALYRFRNNERWYLETPDQEAQHEALVNIFRVVGPWDQTLAAWVRSEGARMLSVQHGRRGWITVADAISQLDIPLKDRRHQHTIEVGAALRRVGCSPVRSASGQVARPELDGAKVTAYVLPVKPAD